ncbi:hypothetical protein ACFL21_04845, partial [Patescibacteria group bacterium]
TETESGTEEPATNQQYTETSTSGYENYSNDATQLIDSRVNSEYINKVPERRQNCYTIMQVVLDAGLPPNIGYAMIANAKAESSIMNQKFGDGGHSIGLFQINDCHFENDNDQFDPNVVISFDKKVYDQNRGEKRQTQEKFEMKPSDRTNPKLNTEYMVYKSILKGSRGEHIINAALYNKRDLDAEANCPLLKQYIPSSVAYLTGLFCIHHERPATKYKSGASRIKDEATELFGADFISQPR